MNATAITKKAGTKFDQLVDLLVALSAHRLLRRVSPPFRGCISFIVTRHLGERQEQRQALKADPDAESWRQTLGPPACVPAPQQATRKPATDVSGAGTTTPSHEQTLDAQACSDPSQDNGEEVEAGGERAREEKHERKEGASFLCSVVPLSVALQQLEIVTVDLLKVDVEGDELAVLHGIDDDDWSKIRQVRRK